MVGELHQLATHSECAEPSPAVTRVVFSEQDLSARDYLKSLYESAGLKIRVDAVGNTFARWIGQEPEAAVVATGSHCDAIPHAGMYDGTVGVLGGLEAIRALQTAGFRPRRGIELVMITSEEPTRFGVGCTGSRVMAGNLTDDDLGHLTDGGGNTFHQARRAAGFDGDVAALPKNYFHRWVELHIEQGPTLEAAGIDIGVVTAIAAPATLTVTVTGSGGHAGAALMNGRRDALCAASELVLAIESIAIESDSDDLVATVGKLDVHPGAVNSIPSRVNFTIDLRDIDPASRDTARSRIEQSADELAQRRGVGIEVNVLHSDPPASANDEIIAATVAACQVAGVSHQKMISRAYHDSLFIAQVAPMGMIFIPCRDGVSHRPDEYSSTTQIQRGVEVLARTLARLAS